MSQQKPTPEQAAEFAQMIKESAHKLNADIISAISAGLNVKLDIHCHSRFMAGSGETVTVKVSLPL